MQGLGYPSYNQGAISLIVLGRGSKAMLALDCSYINLYIQTILRALLSAISLFRKRNLLRSVIYKVAPEMFSIT